MFKFRNTHKFATKLAIGLGLILSANLASANIVLNFDSTSTSSNNPATGASATTELSFSDVGGGVLIGLNFQNTTGQIASFGEGATTSMLTGVAFDLFSPNTGVNNFIAGTNLNTLVEDAVLNPFGTLDIGIADNGNFVGGNANTALAEGQTDFASLILSGTGLSAIDLESAFFDGFTSGSLNFAARFQQVNTLTGSDKLEGGAVDGGTGAVPEPATLALLGLGLLGISIARRRS